MAKRFKKKKAMVGEASAKTSETHASAQLMPSWFNRDWIWGLLLLFAVVLAYSPVWHAGFIWDDDIHLTANPCIIGPFGLMEIWTTKASSICPLTFTAFWLEHKLWGLAPLPYHLVNVFLHGVSAVLLWRLLSSLKIPGAWLGAALWAFHPVQVESVAWITELKNVQSGLFYLLSLFFFVRWLRARATKTPGTWNYGLTLLFAALAMMSKTSTVVLPLVLCLCAWWVEGRWHWRNLARVAPVFLMSIAGVILTIWAQGLHPVAVSDPRIAHTFTGHLAAAGGAVWFYLAKLAWPHPLITIYPLLGLEGNQPLSYLPLLASGLVLLLLWHYRASGTRPYFFAFAYFLVAMLPELELADSYLADHYQYLSSMAPLALAGAGMVLLGDYVLPKKTWLQPTLAAGVLLILATVSWQRVWAYESETTLWTGAVAKNPDCWLGYNNLGNASFNRGNVDEAIVLLEKSLQINPTYDIAHNNLGLALLEKGQVDEALAQVNKAVEMNPNLREARNVLGQALLRKGKTNEAQEQFQLALRIDPSYAEAHNNLGTVLFQKGQVDEAVVEIERAVEIKPDYPDAHYNLGMIFLKQGRAKDATTQFQKVLEMNPNDLEAQKKLAKAIAMVRQKEDQK